jgi:hypothetical protein
MTEGQIIFQSETVTITPSRAFLDRKTYLISDLLSISVKKKDNPNQFLSFILLGIGLGIWIFGLLFWYYSDSSLVQPFLSGMLFIGLGLWLRRETGQRTRYTVQLIDSRGESTALTSTDKAHLIEITDALQSAMDQQQD